VDSSENSAISHQTRSDLVPLFYLYYFLKVTHVFTSCDLHERADPRPRGQKRHKLTRIGGVCKLCETHITYYTHQFLSFLLGDIKHDYSHDNTDTLGGGVYLKQNRKTRGKTAKTCEKDPLGGCVYYLSCLIGKDSLISTRTSSCVH
jgi:hypothetical protein